MPFSTDMLIMIQIAYRSKSHEEQLNVIREEAKRLSRKQKKNDAFRDLLCEMRLLPKRKFGQNIYIDLAYYLFNEPVSSSLTGDFLYIEGFRYSSLATHNEKFKYIIKLARIIRKDKKLLDKYEHTLLSHRRCPKLKFGNCLCRDLAYYMYN